MLKRAQWFGAAAALSIVAALAGTPLVASGCQSTCATAADCGGTSYCSTAVGVCLSAQAVGFCKDLPTTCPDVVVPVCGCDGKQYQNECLAAKARVSVSANGTCSIACGGPSALKCTDPTTYCHFADGNCVAGNAAGTCDPIPSSCSGATPSPVCGCDGKTYASRCDAQGAGTSVLSTGPCPCGGPANTKCETGKYCQIPTGSCAEPTPAGVCVAVPTAASCSTFPSPVCGCDSKTYLNACAAAAAQMSIGASAPCPCGGAAGVTCAATEFCSFAMLGDCLTPGTVGTCEPRPTQCSGVQSPVCGCDGKSYPNPCEATRAGTAVGINGYCPDGGV